MMNMTTHESVLEQIERRAKSKYASYYLINGAPQSGKSTLLRKLKSSMLKAMPTPCQIFGPIPINFRDRVDLADIILQCCVDAAYVETPDNSLAESGLVSICTYLVSNLNNKRQFAVLLDVMNCADEDIPLLAAMFSDIRFLEGDWKNPNFRIIFIVGGYWSGSKLRDYYDSIEVSFPYVNGHNYVEWLGITRTDILTLATECSNATLSELQSSAIEEISGGHPGIIREILQKHGTRELKLGSLLRVANDIASQSEIADILVEVLQKLPEQSLETLKRLLNSRILAADVLEEYLSPLRTLGIVTREQTTSGYFLRFRSWFAELLCRNHAAQLGIGNTQLEQFRIEELIPEVSCINAEAYLLIHEVENLVRSFLATELSKSRQSPLLQGLGQPDEDNRTIYDRSDRWRRSSNLTLARQNPLIAFCSTRDLANLVEEVGYKIQVSTWHSVADSLRKLAYIRDAVMHNQLIDFDELAELQTLRTNIMKAISQSPC